jgi:hypothetical protein
LELLGLRVRGCWLLNEAMLDVRRTFKTDS